MTIVKNEGARHLVNRISRLKRRVRNIHKLPTNPSRTGELSALEWAIPILEQYVLDKYGELPPTREDFYKHEKQEIMERLVRRDGYYCYLCNLTIDPKQMTVDHVVPLSKGGKEAMSNYKLAHNKCNIEKGNKSVREFFRLTSKGELKS